MFGIVCVNMNENCSVFLKKLSVINHQKYMQVSFKWLTANFEHAKLKENLIFFPWMQI